MFSFRKFGISSMLYTGISPTGTPIFSGSLSNIASGRKPSRWNVGYFAIAQPILPAPTIISVCSRSSPRISPICIFRSDTSEAAEAVDVLPNLRRREVHPLAQLLRRNLLHTCAFQLPQMPIISRQTTDYRVRHMPCHPHSPPVHLLSWGISAQFLHVKGISI